MTTRRSRHDQSALLKDLATIAKAQQNRRQALRMLAGIGLLPIIGCGGTTTSTSSGTPSGSSGSSGASGTGGSIGECAEMPNETGGPYPADGTNGPNALTQSGIVKADMRSSFAGMSGVATGIPLALELTIVNTKAACAGLAGYAVYAWHCDQNGRYSIYELTTENYLRGVQPTDANGKATFQTVFPGAYNGRYPHIHFEIFTSLANATAGTGKVKTSQLALPEAACSAVYETAGYAQSKTNFPGTPLARDNVFRDGASLQVASVTGDVTNGYTASLVVGV